MVPLLVACAAAAPVVSTAAAASPLPADAAADSRLAKHSSLAHLKASLLQTLHAGASRVHKLLAGNGAMMGDPEGMGVFHQSTVHKEYDAMTTWWCSSNPPNSKLCARRAAVLALKGQRADKAQKPPHAESPEARKAMSEEAKKMVEAYCKPSSDNGGSAPGTGGLRGSAPGANTTLCARTLSILEMGKRFFRRHVTHRNGTMPMR
jgi:hypothetical protein